MLKRTVSILHPISINRNRNLLSFNMRNTSHLEYFELWHVLKKKPIDIKLRLYLKLEISNINIYLKGDKLLLHGT